MSTENSESELKIFKKDTRVVCQYGEKCYQKNPEHHKKYKHPPKDQKDSREKTVVKTGTKRKIDDCDDSDEFNESDELQTKRRDVDISSRVTDVHSMSPSQSESAGDDDSDVPISNNEKKLFSPSRNDTKAKKSTNSPSKVSNESNNIKEIIRKIFLFDMPDDFYKFYDFCTSLSASSPSSALKTVDLQLVGPYDVLNGMITQVPDDDDDKEKYLRHWRYFYDPPEFQTILKGSDKEGLHYGYWRDECNGKPIFVAKNYANASCKMIPVASNIFGAVKFHIQERLKVANVFEKSKIARILQLLSTFAKDNGIDVEKKSTEMRDRDRQVVANTFHGAGIVVPYDKTTQVGYRTLTTDSDLQKILEKIEKAEHEEIKMKYMRDIEDLVRLAAIAVDECDFGTPLELAHDLFASGIEAVQRPALNLFQMAYSILGRSEFQKIAVVHIKNRNKGFNLSVI